jgi:plasmid replication initiation protein
MSNELTISKSNSFVEASYSMTLDEMRVLSLTLGVFDPTNPKRGFDFTVAEFCKHFPEVNPDIAYVQVQKAIRKISSRWMTLQNDDRILHEVAFVTDRVYFKKEGRFYIEFHEKLLPYIANLKARYTKYELVNIGAFTSTHTIRLYELCSQYKTVGEREIKLEELKDWLQVSDKYDRYNNFNQRVLEPSIAEINAKSDLLIKIEPIKRGRSIVALKFIIKVKKIVTKIERKRPSFPHKNKYGSYVKFEATNPKFSSNEYAKYAYDCLKILDDFYNDISDVTLDDLVNYAKFLAVNQSHKSKFGKEQSILVELKKRGYKLASYELKEIPKDQIDFVG